MCPFHNVNEYRDEYHRLLYRFMICWLVHIREVYRVRWLYKKDARLTLPHFLELDFRVVTSLTSQWGALLSPPLPLFSPLLWDIRGTHITTRSYTKADILVSRWLNWSPPGQYGRHFADDIFRCIFMNEKICILIKISLKFLPKGPIAKNPALV